MFKFVVVCAFVAAAVAEPEPGLIASPYVLPYAAYSTVLSPASTSISSQSSSVIHPSPITYTPQLAFSHYIKKRSASQLATTYNTPYNYYPYNYPTGSFVSAAPFVQAPIAYSGAHLPLVNTHFIKKRSAEASPEPSADPQTFYYPSASTYLTPSTYTSAIATTPYLSSPFVNTYYSSPAVVPFASAHLIKKRSAEPAAEPAAEPSADPLLVYSGYPSTYYAGSRFIPTYPTAAVIKSAPIYSANPFVYSTFIKK